MSFFGFHPIIADWFQRRFAAPTEPQEQGWPHIAAGEHVLIAAPTGSGKTLTAFLSCIDRLYKESLVSPLSDEVRVVYVSPLRALSNDMHRNLETPLAEMFADGRGSEDGRGSRVECPETEDGGALKNGRQSTKDKGQSPIRIGLRTGDTSPGERAKLTRRPPHILVTTPESLYLLLTAARSRETLRNVDTVIVDEIHALVRDKRGSHLGITLERLAAVSSRPLQRIGLSATQKPIDCIAKFLVGIGGGSGIAAEDSGFRVGGPATAEACEERTKNNGQGTKDDNPPSITHHPHSADPQLSTINSQPVIIDVGHARELDLAIDVPPSELGAVCMHEQWAEVYERVVQLINEHRSTLVFVNTRRMAERVSHQLTELLGEDSVGSHHGSLAADIRLKTERQLKSGELKAVVATASLELGIDVGYIDLVIQIGSPRAIATFLQRIGRSGHALGLVPKGRLFALTRDELLESMALIRAVRSGRLDAVRIPEAPLDVLSQQIVAEVAAEEEWDADELFALCRRADSYRNLSREDFDRTLEYLSEGVSRTNGRSRVYLHYDRVNNRLKSRKGARIAAVMNAGAIPEIASYRVVTEPEQTVVGSLDEDFAVESSRGDVFLLGNTSWRIQHVRGSDVTVVDAMGAPPTIPFWFGEAPGRTLELSEELSRLREELEERVGEASPGSRIEGPATEDEGDTSAASQRSTLNAQLNNNPQTKDTIDWLRQSTCCSEFAAEQIVNYVAAQKAAVGVVPTQRRVVFERFFDESGGMQLVVHAPFGGAITRAWGFAMRKRFCRSFDFELQATADDDGFILSLGPQHSFPIESLFPMLTPRNSRSCLEQAVLAAPMFEVRWRWNVTRALLVLKRNGDRKTPPALQRFRADDLLTAVFPRLTGCQEEHTGDIEIPDHPLVRQTMEDCLHEALDIDGLNRVLAEIEAGGIELIARDTREPSPFSYELLNSNPYAFLDGGELQERRTRAVSMRRGLAVESVSDLCRLDPLAIEQVVQEAQPPIRNADELHDALLGRIVWPLCEHRESSVAGPSGLGPPPPEFFDQLARDRRATSVTLPGGSLGWAPAERLSAVLAAYPEASLQPPIEVPRGVRTDWTASEARVEMLRGIVEISGPVTAAELAQYLSLTESQTSAALEALEGEGIVLRGRFRAEESQKLKVDGPEPEIEDRESASQLSPLTSEPAIEWCHRRLLARIHRLTLQGLRREIEPVGVDVFIRFLAQHHGASNVGSTTWLGPNFKRSSPNGDPRFAVSPSGPGPSTLDPRPPSRSGPNGLYEVISLLQGLDIPAVCWERDILPSRVAGYRPDMLDELCLSGEVGWGRLFPPKKNADRARPISSLTRVAPVSIYLRDDLLWLNAAADGVDPATISGPAGEVFDLLNVRGALFAGDILAETRMLPTHLKDALGELTSAGLATADGFAGLRELLGDRLLDVEDRRSRRRNLGVVRRRARAQGAGRWSLWREGRGSRVEGRGPEDRDLGGRGSRRAAGELTEDVPSESDPQLSTANSQPNGRGSRVEGRGLEAVVEEPEQTTKDNVQETTCASQRSTLNSQPSESWAWQLLLRWGVVFRDLLVKEPGAPPWYELVRIYRKLEARGEVRGGRFVAGVGGEQYALGETVRTLRRLRDETPSSASANPTEGLLVVSAADPLNLIGVITDHPRVPATAANRIAYRQGRPLAALKGGETFFFDHETGMASDSANGNPVGTPGAAPRERVSVP